MEINAKKLAEIAKLPDEQFAALVYAVVTAAGGSRMQAKAASASAHRIKEKLLAANEREVEDLTASLDPALRREIMSILDKGGKPNV